MNHSSLPKIPWWKKTTRLIAEATLFAVIFYGVISWQQRNMLATGEQLPIEQLKLLNIQGSVTKYQLNQSEQNTLIYFFAPWCKVCDLSIDNLEKIYQKHSKNLLVLAIVLDWQSLNEIDEFLNKHQLSMPILLGDNNTRNQFNINGYPSYYLISKDGKVLARSRGYSTEVGLQWQLKLNDSI
ncbi:TlpA family protein disulfide reductase [Aliikangiella maris]|uniref:TlpA disulfide reductase family protein n=2 Tax=Aliikangiella maris TaxID=3162458 RepID=A0ABV3MIL2_9GAMM